MLYCCTAIALLFDLDPSRAGVAANPEIFNPLTPEVDILTRFYKEIPFKVVFLLL